MAAVVVNVKSNQAYTLGFRPAARGGGEGSPFPAEPSGWILGGPRLYRSDDQVIYLVVNHPRTDAAGDDYVFRLEPGGVWTPLRHAGALTNERRRDP